MQQNLHGTLAGAKPPKKKKRMGGLIALVLVLSLAMLGGSGFGAYCLMQHWMGAFEMPQTSQNPSSTAAPDQSATAKPQESADRPTVLPEINGKAPVITNAANPVPEIAEACQDGVVCITANQWQTGEDGAKEKNPVSLGTGFLISTDGYIVTNNHIVKNGEEFDVTLSNGETYEATYLGNNASLDIAVLRVQQMQGLLPLAIGDSDALKTGELLIAIGNPAGSGTSLTGTVTVGYASAVNRQLYFNGALQSFIQTDAALNPGNSGGPILNAKGQVVGIATLKSLISSMDQNGNPIASEGIGFAIPINTAMAAVKEIILHGSMESPAIGIYVREYEKEEWQEKNLPGPLVVEDFMPNSPAEKAGMKIGDVLLASGETELKSTDDLLRLIEQKKVGETLPITIWRQGKTQTLSIQIAERADLQ